MYIFCKNPDCSNEFYVRPSHFNKGHCLYCSKDCSISHRQKPNNRCSWCDKEIYVTNGRKNRSKSGLHFCSVEHKNIAARLDGMKEIHPNHYGTSEHYRKIAFDNYPHECAVCGWNEYIYILEVNHKDRNRDNNKIENLEILCPNHHRVFHYLIRLGISGVTGRDTSA